jgi:hypothetical protein
MRNMRQDELRNSLNELQFDMAKLARKVGRPPRVTRTGAHRTLFPSTGRASVYLDTGAGRRATRTEDCRHHRRIARSLGATRRSKLTVFLRVINMV